MYEKRDRSDSKDVDLAGKETARRSPRCYGPCALHSGTGGRWSGSLEVQLLVVRGTDFERDWNGTEAGVIRSESRRFVPMTDIS